MKLMNPGYELEEIGGSLYWNGGKGNCYKGNELSYVNCDFTQTGIKNNYKSYIKNVYWNIGKVPISTASVMYNYERNMYKTKWLGYIGLVYPSDYGFATTTEICRNKVIGYSDLETGWFNSGCTLEDWLYKNNLSLSYTISAASSNENIYPLVIYKYLHFGYNAPTTNNELY